MPGRGPGHEAAYESFLTFLRRRPAEDQISFNQVNGVPSASGCPLGPVFGTAKVWPPNDQWRHLEALMDRTSAGLGSWPAAATGGELVRGSIACYPPVWGRGDKEEPVLGAAREGRIAYGAVHPRLWPLVSAPVRCSMATSMPCCATRTTPSTSVWRWGGGDRHRLAPLCPAVPRPVPGRRRHQLVRHSDENGAVALEWDGPVRPEPVGGTVSPGSSARTTVSPSASST